jgi:hypothetical protein
MTGSLEPSTANETSPFRHLPQPAVLEDTVTSIRGDVPPDPDGGRNAFIAAAVEAGG